MIDSGRSPVHFAEKNYKRTVLMEHCVQKDNQGGKTWKKNRLRKCAYLEQKLRVFIPLAEEESSIYFCACNTKIYKYIR